MNLTLSNWHIKPQESFDRIYPSFVSTFSHIHTRDILFIIGLMTICLLLFILLIQFFVKVRETYQTSQPKKQKNKSYKYQTTYPSYQALLNKDKNHCECLRYSCLPKFQCVKPTCQVLNQSTYYEQIDERQINNSLCRVYTSSNISSSNV
ncbi:unnamed protein product [Rotaria sp. Silwood2]|nr:unnamed protein product [Rotaria sp. Silwood2]CAF2612525.1 unnamed protein product [Rotaria sp. Silwood2]CAF3025788.1 unnamed protein product [Rotaria sp. Silwood2]CAF4133486.1 unnamed protein product [Rotaria sp. Silwood2]CAF4588739.1 unnamed protein product [Rotaria sp. Silwood2]